MADVSEWLPVTSLPTEWRPSLIEFSQAGALQWRARRGLIRSYSENSLAARQRALLEFYATNRSFTLSEDEAREANALLEFSEDVILDQRIDRNFWLSAPVELLNWQTGSISIGSPEELYTLYAGLEVSRSDLASLGLSVDHLPSSLKTPSPEASSPGGRPRNEDWDHWTAALALMVHEGSIQAGDNSPRNVEALVNAISSRLQEDGFKEVPLSTARATAKRVLNALQREGLKEKR